MEWSKSRAAKGARSLLSSLVLSSLCLADSNVTYLYSSPFEKSPSPAKERGAKERGGAD